MYVVARSFMSYILRHGAAESRATSLCRTRGKGARPIFLHQACKSSLYKSCRFLTVARDFKCLSPLLHVIHSRQQLFFPAFSLPYPLRRGAAHLCYPRNDYMNRDTDTFCGTLGRKAGQRLLKLVHFTHRLDRADQERYLPVSKHSPCGK